MDNVFFTLSKLLWLFIKPNNLIVFGLIIIVSLFLFNQSKRAKNYLYIYSTIVLLITLFPIGNWLLYPLEKNFPTEPTLPKTVDGIILLGGSFLTNSSQAWGKPQTNHFADRIHDFIILLNLYPKAKAIFTGGHASINDSFPSEAYYAQQLFERLGIEKNRITYEDKARNTYENALFSKVIAQPKLGEVWVVISTAFHLPRVVGVFCQQGWPVIPYPADFHSNPYQLLSLNFDLMGNLQSLDYAIHEWIGLSAYYFTHKTNAWLPKQCA